MLRCLREGPFLAEATPQPSHQPWHQPLHPRSYIQSIVGSEVSRLKFSNPAYSSSPAYDFPHSHPLGEATCSSRQDRQESFGALSVPLPRHMSDCEFGACVGNYQRREPRPRPHQSGYLHDIAEDHRPAMMPTLHCAKRLLGNMMDLSAPMADRLQSRYSIGRPNELN